MATREAHRFGSAAADRAGGTGDKTTVKTLLSTGSLLAAVAASSCCVVPFALFTLGVSGAWIGNLTALAPYQPYFIALALALLAGAFARVHRRPKAACADGAYCAKPVSDRIARLGFWAATALVAVALAFPYVAPLFIEA